MTILNAILNELNNVPVNKLEDLYSIIHSLQADTKQNTTSESNILSFAGCLSDMSDKDYTQFVNHTKDTRNELFSRDNN